MFKRSIIAGTAFLAVIGTSAFANTQEEVELCLSALAAEAPDADFSFKSKSGGSLAKIKFKMTTEDGETKTVVCKVKRGEIKELDMGA